MVEYSALRVRMYESRNIKTKQISGMVPRKVPDSKTRFLQVGVALAYLVHLYNEFLKSGLAHEKAGLMQS